MRARKRIARSLSILARREDGVAVPTVMLLLVASFALASVSVVGSISTQRGAVHDQDRKTGIAAADAGVYRALLRQNKLTLGGVQCPNGTLQADGWCSPVTETVGDASYTYQVNPVVAGVPATNSFGQGVVTVKIVSTGVRDGVTRRVAVTATALNGQTVFGEERAIGIDWFNVGTGNGKGVWVNSGTNGDFTATNASEVCGNVRHGVGHQFIGQDHQCPGYGISEGNKDLPIPDLTAVRASNDNIRLSNGQDPMSGNVSWNPTTKALSMSGNSSVTLGGNNYLFCELTMEGKSSLIMAQGASVKIYFDSPENCGLTSPATQIDITGNSSITATGWNPDSGTFELPGFYMLGSTTTECKVNMTGTAKTNEFVLYAPRCDVTLWGSSDYYGAVAGKTLDVGGAANLFSNGGLPAINANVVLVYRVDRYIECSAAPATPPDTGC